MTDDELLGARAILATTPTRWFSLVAATPDSLLRREPAPGEWSALGCLRHLVAAEPSHRERVETMLAGRDPAPHGGGPSALGHGPSEHGEAPVSVEPTADEPAEMAERFAALRAEMLSVFDRVTLADLEREGRHPRHGTITLGQLLAHLAAHDLDHTIQAGRALMQPFIEASGPWRRSHAAHDAAALAKR
jgi:uncharacterized damage-inducible protein DinB